MRIKRKLARNAVVRWLLRKLSKGNIMFKVNDQTFDTFEQVVEWAWETHKIDFESVEELTEEDKQQACVELSQLVKDGNGEGNTQT